MRTIRRLFLRLLSVFRSGRTEALPQGRSAEELRCAASRAVGEVEHAKERQRGAPSFGALDSWWLDVKLGLRM